MALPVLLRPSTLALVVTLFVVAFITDASSKSILFAHPSLPLSLTLAQFAVSALAGWALLRCTRGGVQPLPPSWKACAPVLQVTLAQCVGTLTTNVALGAMDVGFVATVKASEALFTAALSRVVQKARFSLALYLSLLTIVCGVVLTAKTEASYSLLGMLATLTSNLCFASRAVLLAKQTTLQRQRLAELEQRRKEAATATTNKQATELASSSHKQATELASSSTSLLLQLDPAELHLDDISTFFYVCGFSTLLLLPFCALLEGDAVLSLLRHHPSVAQSLAVQLLLTGVGQWMYTLASLLLLSRTSPLVHVVMHALRRVYVVALSTYLRDGTLRTLSTQTIVGTALVLTGATWFAREKGRQVRQQPPQVAPACTQQLAAAVKKEQ